MIFMRSLLGMLTVLVLLVSCGRNVEGPAAPKIGNIQGDAILPKDIFGIPYLLNVSVISGAPTPTGSSMANKIVFFEKRGNTIYMFESLKGRLNSDSIKTKELLGEFPIKSELNEGFQIDYANGIDLIFQRRSMHVSDLGAPTTDEVTEITHNFVEKAETRGRYAFIHQYVRVNIPGANGRPSKNESLQVKHAFTPYISSPSFTPKESTKVNKVGFFEAYPVLEAGTGKETTYIMKFNTNKPIVYSLTNNIPAEFKEAVTEGVLYWNRVFGKEVIKVQDMPEGAQIHDPNLNVIQWLDWDTAGFAYANMHADPLTGETLQGFVYMTSVFGRSGVKAAKTILNRILAAKKQRELEGSPEVSLTLKGFHKNEEVCQHDESEFDQLVMDLNALVETIDNETSLSEEEKDAIYKRVANDYIRQVVAHEVGHTLGLRHNFAGSLKNTITPENYEHILKIYLFTGKTPDAVLPGGTVMDYTPLTIASMIGSKIRNNQEPLSYDKQAIEWGYSDKDIDAMEMDTFCTDSNADSDFIDCKRFDYFANPIKGTEYVYGMVKKNWSLTLASKYEDLLKPENRERSLEKRLGLIRETVLTPSKDIKKFLEDYLTLVDFFSSEKSFISLRESYPKTLTAIDESDYKQQISEMKLAAAAKLSNKTGLANFLVQDFMPAKNNEAVTIPVIEQIKGSLNSSVDFLYESAFEKEEIEAIKMRLAKYMEVFETELVKTLATELKSKKFVVQDDAIASKLSALAKALLLTTNEKSVVTEVEITDEDNNTESVKVYDYYFNGDIRKEAFSVLINNFYPEAPSFTRDMKSFRKDIYLEHKKVMDTILHGGRSQDDLDDKTFDWLNNEMALFAPLIQLKLVQLDQ